MPLREAYRGYALRNRWRWLLSRGSVLATVFACGLTAFLSGVGVTMVPGVGEAGLLTKVYYTVGLFVLGGLDLGMPEGGPALGRALLWFAYFAAPLVTASAVVEGIVRVFNPQAWRLRRTRGHIVMAGCGRLTMLYLAKLRGLRRLKPVVIVETRGEHTEAAIARDAFRAHIVTGDINSDAMLEQLNLSHADQVLLLTGDDFANLDAATKILTIAPELGARTIVHVADLGFMRVIADTRVAQECFIFNTYQIAARHLVDTRLLSHFQETEPRDIVVLAGFGRFGQTVLDELQRRALGKFHTVVIIDLVAKMRALVFEEQVGFASGYVREVAVGDLRDPGVWRAVEATVDLSAHRPIFVLGSGDDGINLHAAVWLSAEYPQASVVARSFRQSSFAEEVSRDRNFHVFNVAELLTQCMPDDWFAKPWSGPVRSAEWPLANFR